jgi:hypothetical protein
MKIVKRMLKTECRNLAIPGVTILAAVLVYHLLALTSLYVFPELYFDYLFEVGNAAFTLVILAVSFFLCISVWTEEWKRKTHLFIFSLPVRNSTIFYVKYTAVFLLLTLVLLLLYGGLGVQSLLLWNHFPLSPQFPWTAFVDVLDALGYFFAFWLNLMACIALMFFVVLIHLRYRDWGWLAAIVIFGFLALMLAVPSITYIEISPETSWSKAPTAIAINQVASVATAVLSTLGSLRLVRTISL